MTKTGYGTITNPLSLQDAGAYIISPGETVYLRGGTYTGDYEIDVSGTAEGQITFEPYQDEQVIINGSLQINGDYITINGKYQLIVTNLSITERYYPYDTFPDWIKQGIVVYGNGVNIINCIVHDTTGTAIGLWGAVNTQTLYGCVIYNCGMLNTSRGHGHGIYSNGDDNLVTIKHNAIGNGFELSCKIYCQGTSIDNYTVVENTFFNAGVHGGGPLHKYWNLFIGSFDKDTAANNETVTGNCTYHYRYTGGTGDSSNLLGYNGGITGSAVTGNKFVGPVAMRITNESTLTLTGNTFAGNLEEFTALEYPDNTYETFANLGNTTHVMPNEYITTAGIVTIYNQAEADTVTVDLTSLTGLGAGDTVHVHNIQDFFTDIQTLTLSESKTVDINMQASIRTIAAPTAWTASATTFPTFGCFLVQLHEAAVVERAVVDNSIFTKVIARTVEPVVKFTKTSAKKLTGVARKLYNTVFRS